MKLDALLLFRPNSDGSQITEEVASRLASFTSPCGEVAELSRLTFYCAILGTSVIYGHPNDVEKFRLFFRLFTDSNPPRHFDNI